MEYVSLEGLRLDGRRPMEMRQIRGEIGAVAKADGSAVFQMGNTKVIAAVYGPREILSRIHEHRALFKHRRNKNVSLLVCLPLGELFFFHMKLIKKGITTYEDVAAVRAMSEAPAGSIHNDNQNVIYSPSGYATTGFSGGSSLDQFSDQWQEEQPILVKKKEVRTCSG